MKNVVLVLTLAIVSLAGCFTDVAPGFVGLLVRKTGENRGVDPQPKYGRVYEGVNEEVVIFPITLQNTIWTKSPHEGSPTDESVTVAAAGGTPVNADVGLTFRVDPTKAASLYNRYHIADLGVLADGEIRNTARDCLANHASSITVETLLTTGRNALLGSSLTCLRERLAPHGLVIEGLTFTSALRLPDNVQRAISESLGAQQRLTQTRALAESEQAVARGHAEAERIRAQGDADALLIRTRADAEQRRLMAAAYRDMQASLTPQVLQYMAIQKWNGVPVPTFGANTILSLPSIVP